MQGEKCKTEVPGIKIGERPRHINICLRDVCFIQLGVKSMRGFCFSEKGRGFISRPIGLWEISRVGRR